jgi:DNA replication and repair protein RecF
MKHVTPMTLANMADKNNSMADAGGLAVTRLTLRHYRNYTDARIDLVTAGSAGGDAESDLEPIVLHGPNGAGKTNLLEALSYLAAGRGLRGAKLADVAARHGDGSWSVAARVHGMGGPSEISTGLTSGLTTASASDNGSNEAPGMDRRLVRIDGKRASGPAALAQILPMIWLTPGMDRIFIEGASGRRRFFDQIVCGLNPDHGRLIGTYERALRERMKIMVDAGGRGDGSWLSALEKRMAQTGVAIAAARLDTLSELQAHILSQPESAFPKSSLALKGLLEGLLGTTSALEAEEAFMAQLKAARADDFAAGRTKLGPHRSDLLVHHLGNDIAASFCSTGEQKALLVGIVLADAHMQKALRGAAPILLLDEISAHLDERRRAALFDELSRLKSQAWLSGTDEALFCPLKGRARFLRVEEGRISGDEFQLDVSKPRIVS